MFTYLSIDLLTLIFPLIFSRSTRFGFGKNVVQAWTAVGLASIPFILWDIFFTHMGVWSFNPKFLMGIYFAGLPIEEILFFWTIPFACLFIYAQFQKKNLASRASKVALISWAGLFILFLIIALIYRDKNYTFAVSLLGAALAAFLVWRRPPYLGALCLALIVHYVPFLLVNGLLTFLPVVQYHPQEITGVYLGTIPIEDSIYSFVMFVSVVVLYESLTRRKAR